MGAVSEFPSMFHGSVRQSLHLYVTALITITV